MAAEKDRRWLAMIVLCLGTLMIVLDTTIVNVALPSIRQDLHFSEADLAWVVNAYLLTFGGFLLLGGRLGDLYGHRRLFLAGIGSFTLASMACGLAGSQGFLIAARAVQGLGGAVVEAVALSLVTELFVEDGERARAMGVYGFVGAGGGAIGVLLGGLLTNTFDWHWIFLVNVPLGVVVVVLSRTLVPADKPNPAKQSLDVMGALTVTAAMMLAVYAIVNGPIAGWTSPTTLAKLTGAVVLLGLFVFIQARAKAPLMPLGLFRLRNLAVANVVSIFWAAAMFAWFFLSALYMQLVLGYSPLQVGLSFLPANLIMAAMSLGLSAKLVLRFGIKPNLGVGMLLITFGLAWLARAPVDGHFIADILPPMVFLGLGCGTAFNPVLLAAMNGVEAKDSGLASAIINTSFMMGGSLGLATLASLATSRTQTLVAAGQSQALALTGGYSAAFVIGAAFALVATVLSLSLLRATAVTPEAAAGVHAA